MAMHIDKGIAELRLYSGFYTKDTKSYVFIALGTAVLFSRKLNMPLAFSLSCYREPKDLNQSYHQRLQSEKFINRFANPRDVIFFLKYFITIEKYYIYTQKHTHTCIHTLTILQCTNNKHFPTYIISLCVCALLKT